MRAGERRREGGNEERGEELQITFETFSSAKING